MKSPHHHLLLLLLLLHRYFHSNFRSTNRPNSTIIILLLISAICAVLSITEIILFIASKLHPLTYLILQLVKTTTWLVLFALAAVGTTRLEEEQGYSLGSSTGSFIFVGFAENLALL